MEYFKGIATSVVVTKRIVRGRFEATFFDVVFLIGDTKCVLDSMIEVPVFEGDELIVVGSSDDGLVRVVAYKNVSKGLSNSVGGQLFFLGYFFVITSFSAMLFIAVFSTVFRGYEYLLLVAFSVPIGVGCFILQHNSRLRKASNILRRLS